MRYILLINENESDWLAMTPEEQGAVFGEYMRFTESIKASGQYVAGSPLEPSTTATTVRVRGGKVQTTDGPFAETREQLGGFYIVEAANLDEAIALAARIPTARVGAIEVRPLLTPGARLSAPQSADQQSAGV
jgi:hypothetical protein